MTKTEGPSRKFRRENTKAPMHKKCQNATAGTVRRAKRPINLGSMMGRPLGEQHAMVRETPINAFQYLETSGNGGFTDNPELFVAAVKSLRLEPKTYTFVVDNKSDADRLRSRLTRYLRLGGYTYSSTTRTPPVVDGAELILVVNDNGRIVQE